MNGDEPSGSIRTPLLLAAVVLFNSAGNLALSAGMKRVGAIQSWSVPSLAWTAWGAFTSGSIWIGIALLALFMLSYLLLLSWADYSYVHPASAAGYAIVPLFGYAFLGDHVTPLRWAGVLLICAGVVLVGRTPVTTTAPDRRTQPVRRDAAVSTTGVL